MLYDLRHSIRRDRKFLVAYWNSKPISAEHMGFDTAWKDKGTNEAINELALPPIHEIICGKVNPLTLTKAKAFPEWETWKSYMNKEFTSLQDKGIFELIKRSDLPRNSNLSKLNGFTNQAE